MLTSKIIRQAPVILVSPPKGYEELIAHIWEKLLEYYPNAKYLNGSELIKDNTYIDIDDRGSVYSLIFGGEGDIFRKYKYYGDLDYNLKN